MFTHLQVSGEMTFLSSFIRTIITTEGFSARVGEHMAVKAPLVS